MLQLQTFVLKIMYEGAKTVTWNVTFIKR